ncbi:MAG TPA: hypothetical protein VHL52_12515 [Acidimicrobiia bacterium]|nr:hypothetical protein [Acidimicrobiia bacterium]
MTDERKTVMAIPMAGRLAWGLWGASAGLLLAGAVVSPAVFFGVGAGDNAGDFGGVVIAAVALSFATVGAFVGWRRPDNPIGWLVAAWGLVMSFIVFAASYTSPATTGLRPGAEWVAWGVASIWHPAFALLVFVLLLFPHGRLPSPRWRPFAYFAAFVYTLLAVSGAISPETVPFYFPDLRSPLRLPGGDAATAVFDLLLAGQLLLVATALAAQVLRLRRSRGPERQQITWFVYAVVVSVGVFIGGIVVLGAGYLFPIFSLIPLAVGVAILRYRLYEIHRLISRTVTYGLVVGTLVAVYAGGVLLLESLLPLQGELAVSASTLAVAALFNPMRRRVQRGVDRRFNRARYDAARVLDDFTVRLRDQRDLDELIADLLAVVATTVQPQAAGLSIRGNER